MGWRYDKIKYPINFAHFRFSLSTHLSFLSMLNAATSLQLVNNFCNEFFSLIYSTALISSFNLKFFLEYHQKYDKIDKNCYMTKIIILN